jgi:hypothetical protein
MTENDADRQMAELKSENERLRALLHQSGIETADASLALARRDYRHERQLAGEQTRVAQAEENARLAEDRADLAEAKHTNLTAIDAALLTNTEFGRRILENSTDCIKVLDLEGLSLLKNLSDHRGCSSATPTVGDARKFVRSRNPVTVIVKIESRNLDRTPYKGRISPERRRDSTIAVCSGCATFVPMMESTDLGKCHDLASGRRLDRAGIRTVFI